VTNITLQTKEILAITISLMVISFILPFGLVLIGNAGNTIIDTEDDLGHYLGTYSFYDDIIGNEPSGFSIQDAGGTCKVIGGFTTHNKVVEFKKESTSQIWMQSILGISPVIDYGSLECYIAITNVSRHFHIQCWDVMDLELEIRIKDDKWDFYNGTYNNIQGISDPINNEWYHIRIDFEATAGNYQGLSEDTWKIYINDVMYGAYSWDGGSGSRITNIYFQMEQVIPAGYYAYLDAVGYTWLGYELGENKNLREIDVYLSDVIDPTVLTVLTVLLPIFIVITVAMYFITPKKK